MRRRGRSDVLKPQCPWCWSCESLVYRSIGQYVHDDRYRRRRRCVSCHKTWPTIEHLDLEQFAQDLAKEGKTLEDLDLNPTIGAAEAAAFVRKMFGEEPKAP